MVLCMVGGLLFNFASLTNAAIGTFTGVGEYTMTVYDNPEIGVRRAIDYAKRDASEKAGVYIENYTRAENMQVVTDEIATISSQNITINEQKIDKQIMSTGMILIRATITAIIDTADVEAFWKQQEKERLMRIEKYKRLKKEKEIFYKNSLQLKERIAILQQNGVGNEIEIAREQERQNREFLALQKVEEGDSTTGDESIRKYNEALSINPKIIEGYGGLGFIYKSKGHFETAITNYNKALLVGSDDERCVGIYNDRGVAYFDQKEYDRAVADYNKAITIDPNYAFAYSNRGYVYYEQKELNKAMADFNRAIALESDLAEAYLNRGCVYDESGDSQRAIADYNKAISLRKYYSDAYCNRGVAYYQLGNVKQAMTDLNYALKLNTNDYKAYSNRGLIYYDAYDYSKAMVDLNTSIRIEPSYAIAYYNRGNVYYELKKYNNAITDYKKAIALGLDYEGVHQALQDAYKSAKKR